MTLDELKRLRERMNGANYVTLAETCRVLLDREIEREAPLDGPFMRAVEASFKTNQGGGGDAKRAIPVPVTESVEVRAQGTPDSAAAASFEERVARAFAFVIDEGLRLGNSHLAIHDEIRRRLRAEDANAAKDAEIERLTSLLETWRSAAEERMEQILAHEKEIARLKAALMEASKLMHSDDPEGVEDLIRQRDEARREAAARAKTITRMGEDAETATKEYWEIRHDRDALKAALDEAKAMYVVASDDRTRLRAKLDVAEKECDRARLILGAYDSLDGGYGSRDWIQFHDARRSASRAKESDHA